MTDNRKRDKNGNLIDYNLPISSYEDYLKNIDYLTLGIITYYSNKTFEDPNELLDTQELCRWVYKNKLLKNQEDIEKLSKNKFTTVMRNVRKLAKMDNNLVVATNSDNGIIYYINYHTSPHGYFVTIHHEILRYLLDTANSNVIKVYIYLKYRCKNGKAKVTREELAEAIGLSPKSDNNLKTIGNITNSLNDKLIKKTYEYITYIDEKGNEGTKRYCHYEIIEDKKVIENIEEIKKIKPIKEKDR